MPSFSSLKGSLEGKKTYIFAAFVGITAVFQYLGVFSDEVAKSLYILFGAGSVASLRAGISKR